MRVLLIGLIVGGMVTPAPPATLATAERLAGQKVIVAGTLDARTRRIQVESIAPAQ